MSAEFTPGPWSVGGGTSEHRDIEAENGTFVVYGFARDNTGVLKEADARLIAAAPDLYAALKAARQFIVNGIEFGFIRMPDADTPDSAHKTLPAIDAALARVEAA